MATPRPSIVRGPFLVDAHVHFYPCYRPAPFLDGALGNFARQRRRLGIGATAPSFLLLTETADDHWFSELRDRAAAGGRGRWSLRTTGDDCSLLATHESGGRIVVVAGRQAAAREGLEVLALGLDREVPDGLPLRETLDRVLGQGAVPAVPWGFGKWWLRRGTLLRALVDDPPDGVIFLGDNGGRPRRLGTPPLFGHAGARGIRTLPGSDPLPFPWHEARAGSNGFVLEGGLDLDRPGESLKERLRALEAQPRPYGDGESLPLFLLHQVAMQLRKRGRAARRRLERR